ncbi:hypothetical protein BGZ70_006006, partial [Mortierella alpina]
HLHQHCKDPSPAYTPLPHRRSFISHPPNAVNRFPFGIPPLSAKLDQVVPPADGNDALSSLWKKSAPAQEPYFRTRHTIASQHTLSTMGGVLFSLDEEPKEFNEDMYIAMRNRIFELEAKTVNYAPFNRSRKRPVDIMDDYPVHPHSRHGQGPPSGYHGSHRYGHEDEEGGHHSKRTAPPHDSYVYRPVPSFPSWYTPETYLASSHPHAYGPHVRERNSRPQDREREQLREVKPQP